MNIDGELYKRRMRMLINNRVPTQAVIAARLGVTVGTYKRWEDYDWIPKIQYERAFKELFECNAFEGERE